MYNCAEKMTWTAKKAGNCSVHEFDERASLGDSWKCINTVYSIVVGAGTSLASSGSHVPSERDSDSGSHPTTCKRSFYKNK